jgi:serine/threonine protein kinase
MKPSGKPTRERFRPFYILPGTRIGAYVVRDAIGQGGGQMAYLAEAADGREVVLKVSRFPNGRKGSRNWEMHRRFMRQVTYLLQLGDVPGVAEVFAHGVYPDGSKSGHPYIVQEWVRGGVSILDWFRNKPHPLKAIVDAWMVLANTCEEMSRRGISNRDLKPQNILMTSQGIPKIIDFDSGVADGTQPLTKHGACGWPGTKRYYSPEMCHVILTDWHRWGVTRTPFDYRPPGDLHALGVILYEVLTGKYPFDEGEDDEDLIGHIAYQVPERPRTLNPQVPFGLDKVTMKLLAKAPHLRYHSGGELAAELEALLSTADDWIRPFQTPAKEPRSDSSHSQTNRSTKKVASTPHTPRVTQGSAALNMAPSAIVLAEPSALAIRGPRSVLRLEPAPRPEPAPMPPVPRRRALPLAAKLALVLVVSSLVFGQHGVAGSLSEKGKMLLGEAKKAGLAVISMALTACAGLTGKVRTSEQDWLAKCPPASRKAVEELRIYPDEGMANILPGPNAILHHPGVELRNGPIEVTAGLPARGGGIEAKLYGEIRTGSDGASLHFTKLQEYEESDDGDHPSGRIHDICAYAAAWGYGDHPGLPIASDPPPASELHPGFVFVTTMNLELHFAH